MARYECARCRATCFTTDPPHLCPDVAARHKRRARQREAVIELLEEGRAKGLPWEETAEAIVTRLAQMGVASD